MGNLLPPFSLAFITAISNVLAQTESPGLTGSEIRAALQRTNVSEPEPGNNKRESLRITLNNVQARNKAGNVVVRFITEAMDPTLYAQPDQRARWRELQTQLNSAMAMAGLRVNEQGKVAKLPRAARSLDDVARLTSSLKEELQRRGCHAVLLAYCREELVAESLFHATSEAAKSVFERIRQLSGSTDDGAALLDYAFGAKTGDPILRINALATESDRSEHRGFKNLLLGIHGHFRNPRAHTPRLLANEDRSDFLDSFSLFSYVHRKLDVVANTAESNQP